jgi:hypothetical protein
MIVKGHSIYSAAISFISVAVSVYQLCCGEEKVMVQDKCIKRYQITRDKNPWLGFTSSYKDEEESKKINSVSLRIQSISLLQVWRNTQKRAFLL